MVLLRLILMFLLSLIRWALKPIYAIYTASGEVIEHLQQLNNETFTKAQ